VLLLGSSLAISILFLPKEQKNLLHSIFQSLFEAFLQIAKGITYIIPLGIWAFITLFTKDIMLQGIEIYKSLFLYTAVIISANLLQAFVVLPLLLKFKNISSRKLYAGVNKALTVAFFSKSSNAALPLTIDSMESNMDIPKKISRFSLPLCSTINMNGCAAFIITTVLFVATSSGMTFSIMDMALWVFIATFVAIGNAGIPMGCYFLSGALLSSMGVSLNLLGLILPIYAFLDMIETSLNVWSDCCVTSIVAKEIEAQEKATKRTSTPLQSNA